jgi:nucleoside-diphosphate-sugar epimerase
VKVLVTGAAGFIGSNVAHGLVTAGHTVVGLDAMLTTLYPRADKERNVRTLMGHEGFEFLEADLCGFVLDDYVAWADAVIHEAAMPGLILSWTEFDAYNRANLMATQRLLESLRRVGRTQLVHASTSSVYGANAVGGEEQPTAPYSPYGVTKLAAENLIAAYRANFGIRATVLRYFSVYGPGQRPDMAYSLFCKALLEGTPIKVYGDGRQSRSNTYIGDVVAATISAALAGEDGLVANVCGGEAIALIDAIEVLADELGIAPTVHFEEPRAGDQRFTSGDSSRIRAALGWEPRTLVRDGLRRQARAAASRHHSSS